MIWTVILAIALIPILVSSILIPDFTFSDFSIKLRAFIHKTPDLSAGQIRLFFVVWHNTLC